LIPGVVKAQQDKEKAAATPVKASGTAGASATGN
jgi:hypothetical protein